MDFVLYGLQIVVAAISLSVVGGLALAVAVGVTVLFMTGAPD